MSDRRLFAWASTSARVVAGAVVAVAVVAGTVVAVSVPWPTLGREPVAVVATPAPAVTTLVCAGGLLVQGRDVTAAGVLEQASAQAVTVGVLPGSPDPDAVRLTAPDVPEGEGPAAFSIPPQDSARTDAAAAGSSTVRDADLAGFAASPCRPPLMESWLVGGSASVGASDFIVLANPGTSTATVQLTVFGVGGPVVPPGGVDVIVPPTAQRVVPLSGLALGESSPVIRVNAVGAPVQAMIQSSLTRVLVPGGIDQSGAITGPAEDVSIVGVDVPATDAGVAGQGALTVARVLAPTSSTEATITVRPVGADTAALEPQTVPLQAGLPTEVSLAGLAAGQYVVEIEAGAPVVAGVWQATGFGEASDFAWFLPSPPMTGPTLVAVPFGPAATITVVNDDASVAQVVVSGSGGGVVDTIELAGGESAAVRVASGQSYVVDGGGAAVLAAVTLSAADALAGFPVWPADAAAPPITIYP